MLVGDVKPVKKVEVPYYKATENIPWDLRTDVGFAPFQTTFRLFGISPCCNCFVEMVATDCMSVDCSKGDLGTR